MVKGDRAISPLRRANPGPGRVPCSRSPRKPGQRWTRIQPSHTTRPHKAPRLTPELKATQLEGDEAIANLDEVHQGVEVVGSQDEAVARPVVAPAAQHQVPTQRVLQRASQVLIENGVEVVVISAWNSGQTDK